MRCKAPVHPSESPILSWVPERAIIVLAKEIVENNPMVSGTEIPAVAVINPVTPRVPERVMEAAAMVPVKVGDADITTFPEPVIGFDTSCLEPFVKTA